MKCYFASFLSEDGFFLHDSKRRQHKFFFVFFKNIIFTHTDLIFYTMILRNKSIHEILTGTHTIYSFGVYNKKTRTQTHTHTHTGDLCYLYISILNSQSFIAAPSIVP